MASPAAPFSSDPQLTTVANMVRSPDYKDLYSNYTRVGVSPSDLNIVFSRIGETSNNQPLIEDLVMVRMSPQQFKVFVDHVVKTMTAWESVFGEVAVTSKPQDEDKMKAGMTRLKDAIAKASV